MDELFKSSTKQSVASPVIGSKVCSKKGIKQQTAFFFYEKSIFLNVADSSSFACMIEVESSLTKCTSQVSNL